MSLMNEELYKADTNDASIYIMTKEQMLAHTETPPAIRNKIFSAHSELIEATDKRADLCKQVKFTQRSFDGDSSHGAVVPIKSPSKELLQQIKTSTEQIQKNHRQTSRYNSNGYGVLHLNLSGVNHG